MITTTDKQYDLIVSLMNEKDLMAETRPAWRARTVRLAQNRDEILELDRTAASALITYLFGLPARAQTLVNVPAGHYALLDSEMEAVTFCRVDRPTEGKWARRIFVQLQHGDEYTRINRAASVTILESIVKQGVKECSARYGHEIGRCGVCSRTLTNAESRLDGIGPICKANQGW